MELLNNFSFKGVAPGAAVRSNLVAAADNPLGLLAQLPGTWVGVGFNQIWRPVRDAQNSKQDHFLQLNQTTETIQFDEIPGDIPNRGLLQGDINLHGIRYLQQVQDAHVLGPDGKPAGIHLEPGLWLTVPATTDPDNVATVARLASIPHGTTIVTQGTAARTDGPPDFAAADITPFVVGQPQNRVPFPESNLSQAAAFRSPPEDIPGVTQAMLDNPDSVLAAAIAGQNIVSTTTLHISTSIATVNPPATGGGTANIAFLQGAAGGPNAQAVQVDATFWIEELRQPDGSSKLQLQYTQRVLLNFNGLSWPHVSVATLTKL